MDVPPGAGPPRTVLGPYVIQDVIRRGRAGETLRAHDAARDRIVALKLLTADTADREYRSRFERACAITRTLREPHVVPVLDHGEIGGRLFVAMPLLPGPDLGTVLRGAELDPRRAVSVLEAVCHALAGAHARGLVHRNVKPSNVIFADPAATDGRLADFGLVSRNGLSLDYTAPERFRGGATDHREDVYAAGCVLYTCLTGERPYPGRSLPERMQGHLAGPIPRPSQHRPGVPAAFDDVIAVALAKTAAERFPTVGTLAAAARAAVGEPSEKSPGTSGAPGDVRGLNGSPRGGPPTSRDVRDEQDRHR